MRWRFIDADLSVTVSVAYAVTYADTRARAVTRASSESGARRKLAVAFLHRAVADAWNGRLCGRRGLPGP
jgi:hypothetical protein